MRSHRHKFHPLLHSGHLIEEQLRLRLAPLGVQPRQARILKVLDDLGCASQVDLARRFNVTAASMSTMTSRLIKAGFIAKDHDQRELRCNILTLTDSGRGMLTAIYEAWEEMDRVIEDAIGADKAKALGELTLELRNGLGGRAPSEA